MWMNEFEPDYRVPPCETLCSVMCEQGVTLEKLVVVGGLDPHIARCLVTGDIAITQPLAKKLERATGVPWKFWLQRQIDYEEGR